MDLTKLNRRTFLKASALTGTTAAISQMTGGLIEDAHAAAKPAAVTAIKDETKIVKTSCRACIHD